MSGPALTPDTQAVLDHLLKFAARYPSVSVEIEPIAAGGGCEVVVDLIPAKLEACNLSFRLDHGRAEALFASNERFSAVNGGREVLFADPKQSQLRLNLRADYRDLHALCETIAAGRIKPHAALWFRRWLDPLGAHLELDQVKVYAGDRQGFLLGILALFFIVSFKDSEFHPWE